MPKSYFQTNDKICPANLKKLKKDETTGENPILARLDNTSKSAYLVYEESGKRVPEGSLYEYDPTEGKFFIHQKESRIGAITVAQYKSKVLVNARGERVSLAKMQKTENNEYFIQTENDTQRVLTRGQFYAQQYIYSDSKEKVPVNRPILGISPHHYVVEEGIKVAVEKRSSAYWNAWKFVEDHSRAPKEKTPYKREGKFYMKVKDKDGEEVEKEVVKNRTIWRKKANKRKLTASQEPLNLFPVPEPYQSFSQPTPQPLPFFQSMLISNLETVKPSFIASTSTTPIPESTNAPLSCREFVLERRGIRRKCRALWFTSFRESELE